MVVALLVLGGGYLVYLKNKSTDITICQPPYCMPGIPKPTITVSTTTVNSGWSKYSDTAFEFEYPSLLTVKKVQDAVTLSHSIAYKHPNLCDFKGDAPPLEKVNDFGVAISIVDQSIKDYVVSKSFPNWDYVSANPYTFGTLNGYKVMQGIEGCGSYIYYLEINPIKTLVINRSLITELTGISSDTNKYLSLPGIISPTQEEEYFNKILSSIKIK